MTRFKGMLRRGAIVASAFATCAVFAAASPAAAAVTLPVAAGDDFTVRVTSWRDLPFRNVVRQEYDYSCGSAALATLLRYHYGRAISETEIFKAMYAVGDQPKIRKVGFSLLDMKRYLQSAGYSADGYRLPLAEVERRGVPGIALIKTGSYRHFVVIKGVRGDSILVGDPVLGAKVLHRADFEKMWSGIFFVINDKVNVVFNSDKEWNAIPHTARVPYLGEHSSIATLVDMPTLYQISNIEVIH
jgi:predicted double-glycine peptidase